MLLPLFPLVIRVLEAVGCVCIAEIGYEPYEQPPILLLIDKFSHFVNIYEISRFFVMRRYEGDDLMASLGRWAKDK